jgi:hypothetical protein
MAHHGDEGDGIIMNKLLSDYESARKAIFEYCGVPENGRGIEIGAVSYPWSIKGKAVTLLFSDTDKQSWTIYTDFRDVCGMYAGTDITMVLIDHGDYPPDYEWYALDNALEVKDGGNNE